MDALCSLRAGTPKPDPIPTSTLHYHNAYHNAERVGGGLWRLRRNEEIEKPHKMGLLESCRTWIRTRTN
jgi:hypothetical protein